MAGKPLVLENLTAKSRQAATGGKPVASSSDPLNRAVGDVKRFFETNLLDPTKKLADAATNFAAGPPLDIVDVVIIGAGLSGLACAEHLLEKSPSLRMVIFDANERVGGRTKTDMLALGGRALSVDSGGQWLGPMHTEMLKLLKRLDIATVPQFDEGAHVYTQGALTHKTYNGEQPPYGTLASLELQYRVFAVIDALAEDVDLTDPAQTPDATKLDSFSVAAYFERRLYTRTAKDAINLVCVATFGCEAAQMSMLQFLYEVKASGGLEAVMKVKGGAQECRIVGGAQQVCEGLADAVRARHAESVKIELGMRVVSIRARKPYNEHGVMVTAGDGRRYATRVVVSAGCPSLVLRQVSFSPRLSSRAEHFAARTFRGAYAKAVLVYSAPWWRNAGFSGMGCNTRPDVEHCVSLCYDYCGMQSAGDTAGPQAAGLMCLVAGEMAITMADASPEERRASVLRSVQRMFPECREASNPVLYHEGTLWHRDVNAMGCPSLVYPPGQFARLAAPVVLGTPLASVKDVANRPLLFFASTGVATEHPGYMEGAVRQGIRVATMANRALNEMAAARRGMVSKETFDENEADEDVTGGWVPAKGYGP